VNAGVTLAGASSISNPMWSLVALVAAVCGGLVYYRRRQGPEVREFCMAALTADDRRFLRAPLRHTRTRLNAEMHSPFEGGAMVETPEGEGPYDVLTEENVERVLNEMRPYLMADGGNVELVEIDGPIVYLKLQGACGSCTSSAITMTQGIKKRLMAAIPDILEIEEVREERESRPLTPENVESVLEDIRPYLNGAGGGDVILEGVDGTTVYLRLEGPAREVPTIRVAITQKLKENMLDIQAVHMLN
jgi:Fe-S cluster biogenesis protein NfuA